MFLSGVLLLSASAVLHCPGLPDAADTNENRTADRDNTNTAEHITAEVDNISMQCYWMCFCVNLEAK